MNAAASIMPIPKRFILDLKKKFLILKTGQRWEDGKFIIFLAIIFCIFSASKGSFAQELYFSSGLIKNAEDHDNSYSWQVSYRENITNHFGWSFSWLNEGHFYGHHRDGQVFQTRVFSDLLNHQFSIAAGAGPYLYYDTEIDSHNSYENSHGWGVVFNLTATCYKFTPWLFQVSSNHVYTRDDMDTNSILIGLGYQLSPRDPVWPTAGASPAAERTVKNEFTVYIGQTILNSFKSQDALATGMDYRRNIARYLDWTIGWMYEGNAKLSRRNGITSQIWPTRSFFGNRLSLGVGLGIYLAVDTRDNNDLGGDGEGFVVGLVSMTTSYRFSDHLLVRLCWNRTVTRYSHDTDVIMAGLGILFGP